MSWYKIKILDKEINWASVLASGVLFVGLEIWRRKYIAKQIKKDISLAIGQIKPTENSAQTQSLLDDILDRI
jgi:hypothetical protein|tara:strand:- start:981 stop:1196 length:216 start_codon:yes stop_codon:yes gene_type:complete